MKAPMNPAAMVIGLRVTWLEEVLKVILRVEGTQSIMDTCCLNRYRMR